jgi:hypothetical protein
MFSKTVIAAVFAAVVAAQQNPTTAPATGEVVPGCKPYTLKWNPVSAGTVSIEIISGATQGTQVPVGKIATGIPNTGSFVWTPEASLGANAFTGYKIYNDGSATGEFTYSVPFKIDASSCAVPTTSSSAPVETPTESSYPTETASASETTSMSYPTETPVIPSPSSSSICTTTSTVYVQAPSPTAPAETPVAPYPTAPAGTGAPYPSGTAPAGTGYPTTLAPLPSGTGAPVPYPSATPPAQEFPGAASGVKAGLGLAGAAAAFILML